MKRVGLMLLMGVFVLGLAGIAKGADVGLPDLKATITDVSVTYVNYNCIYTEKVAVESIGAEPAPAHVPVTERCVGIST